MRTNMRTMALLLLLTLVSTLTPSHALWLPQVFSSHMVLQRAPQRAQIYGSTTLPYQSINITLDDTSYLVLSDANARFTYSLPPQRASINRVLIVSSSDSSVFHFDNVAFGDVILCSGQSNQEISVGYTIGGAEAIADSINYPNLRLFTIANMMSAAPLNDTSSRFPDQAQWVVSAPERLNGTSPTLLPDARSAALNYFSAVCYYTGRDIYKGLNGDVPIGLIEAPWSGTRIEVWISAERVQSCGIVQPISSVFPSEPSCLYNGMIAAITQYRIAHVLWYQGESNVQNTNQYACLLSTLIEDWREKFQHEIGFFWVVIAAYKSGQNPQWMEIRQVQADLKLPSTGLATAQDLGDESAPNSIHPRLKAQVGHRLALSVLRRMYQQEAIVSDGPAYSDLLWPVSSGIGEAQTVILRFSPSSATTQGLRLNDTAGCTACCKSLAGSPIFLQTEDGVLHRALVKVWPTAFIVTATLPASASNSSLIVAASLNYEPYPECTIMADASLPHLPFNVSRYAVSS